MDAIYILSIHTLTWERFWTFTDFYTDECLGFARINLITQLTVVNWV